MSDSSETTTINKSTTIIDDDKNTKLHHYAATNNEDELLKLLEKLSEQKIDVENYLGWTPLMMASKNGHLKIVELLLKHRADATKRNRYGISVFFMTISSGCLEMVKLMLQHLLCGGISKQSLQKLFSPLALAALFCHQDILTYLIEKNFNLNAATPITGITPLMFASAMDNSEAFTLLVNKGADKTIKNYIGFTAEGITEIRNQKAERKHNESNVCSTSPNIILNGSQLQPPQNHPVSPYFVISPQPTFISVPANQFFPPVRKSSNIMSPGFYFTTPNVTPITPLNLIPSPQVFFPPEFSPSPIYATNSMSSSYFNNVSDMLNSRLNSNNMYLSPQPHTMNYPSPCV